MGYRWLDLEDVLPFVPDMKKEGVSKVARSSRGFLTAYRKNNIDDWWENRRENFVQRHMAQVKKRNEKLWVHGHPSRRHLALIAWAYSPTPTRLRKYIQDRPIKNPAPGYNSRKWIAQDWRTIQLHKGGISYERKCGEGSTLPSGRKRLCLPIYVIEKVAKTPEGVEVLYRQAQKKQNAKAGERVPWHPLIKKYWSNLEKT